MVKQLPFKHHCESNDVSITDETNIFHSCHIKIPNPIPMDMEAYDKTDQKWINPHIIPSLGLSAQSEHEKKAHLFVEEDEQLICLNNTNNVDGDGIDPHFDFDSKSDSDFFTNQN